MNFNKKDFEEVAILNKKVKKNSLMIKIISFIITLCVTGVVIYLVYNLIIIHNYV